MTSEATILEFENGKASQPFAAVPADTVVMIPECLFNVTDVCRNKIREVKKEQKEKSKCQTYAPTSRKNSNNRQTSTQNQI